MNDPGADIPWPDSDSSPVREGLRLLVLIAVFLVLPMLLIAAANPAAQGCGGG
jgi:hypothetical protein